MRSLTTIINGLKNQFPLCCIVHYALDELFKRLPAYRRGIIIAKQKIYVPCLLHKHDAIPIHHNDICVDFTDFLTYTKEW